MSSARPLTPLSNGLVFVLYRNRFSKHPVRVARSWSEFVDFIVHYVEESLCTVAEGPSRCVGKKCPYKSNSSIPNNPMAWSPVEIDGLRLDKNVRALTLLSLDFDHVSDEQAAGVARALAGRAYVTHTTHNNRVGDACFRVILPLSRPVPAGLWHKFLPAAVDLLGVTVRTTDKKGRVVLQPDRVCKNRDRLYYRPSHPKDAPHSASAHEGSVLDVDAVLERARLTSEPAREHVSRELPETAAWNLESQAVEEAIDTIARHMPDRQRHELALALGGMLRAHGAAQEDAHYILHEGFLAGGSDDPEERAKTVEHTYALSPESAMTGFTRVSEILGLSEARDIGYCFAEAAREELFERLTDFTDHEPGSLPSLPVAPSVNIHDVADAVSALATKLARNVDHDTAILSVLVRRVLAGKPMGTLDGLGDVETVKIGKQAGLPAEEAVCEVFFRIGLALDQSPLPSKAEEQALWGALAEVARASLHVTPAQSGKDWLKIAQSNFFSARAVKVNDARERARQKVDRSEVARAQLQIPPPLPDQHFGPPDGLEWEQFVSKNATGTYDSTLDNARLILTNHPDFCGYLRFNVVSKRVEATGGVPAKLGKNGLDDLVVRIADYFTRTFHFTVDDRKLKTRILSVARMNEYDPVAVYLDRVRWDGVPRLDVWLQMYCGAEQVENAEYLRLVGRRWFIALVARGIKVATSRSPSGPGCKVDYVLVLEGLGALGKSTVFEILGGDYFCDTAISLGDKDSRMMAAMYWICELAELVAFRRASHDSLKAFFSSSKDKFRLPYGTEIEEFARRCLFVATTNDYHYLGDPNGNRKYLPVKCVYRVDQLAMLRRDRDQLMAEAVAALRAGEKWWFDYDEVPITEAETRGRMVETPISIKVEEWWYALEKKERPAVFTSVDVAEQALDMDLSQVKDSHIQSIGYVLRDMGFIKKRDTGGTKRVWRYYATERLMAAERVESRRRGLFVLPGGKKDENNT
jgi:predicted P-loop ATPase